MSDLLAKCNGVMFKDSPIASDVSKVLFTVLHLLYMMHRMSGIDIPARKNIQAMIKSEHYDRHKLELIRRDIEKIKNDQGPDSMYYETFIQILEYINAVLKVLD